MSTRESCERSRVATQAASDQSWKAAEDYLPLLIVAHHTGIADTSLVKIACGLVAAEVLKRRGDRILSDIDSEAAIRRAEEGERRG